MSLLQRIARTAQITGATVSKAFARRRAPKPADRPLGFVQATIDDAFFEPLPAEELAAWGETAQ